MTLSSRLRLDTLLLALAVAITAALLVAMTGRSVADVGEPGFSIPPAVTGIEARSTPRGIEVSWSPVAATPEVTNYVIHAGPGSCPVTVGPGRTTAILPYLANRQNYLPEVQAVNAYGYSPVANGGLTYVSSPRRRTPFRNVQILEFSDFHGAIEASNSRTSIGAARLTNAFRSDRARSKRTFTVASGDSIGGAPPISSAFEEVPTIEALNLMGLDVTTFGNHEHDRPLSHLRRMMSLSDFPWTVANYSSLDPLRARGNPARPYVIIERGGVKVGFVGMNTEDTEQVVPAPNLAYDGGRKSIDISASVEPVQDRIDAARSAGAQVVVVLLHQGWSLNFEGQPTGRLIEVSRALRGADVVFGGHSHQTFSSIIGGRPTVQTRNSGIEYTRTQICLNTDTGKVVGSSVDYRRYSDVEMPNRPDGDARTAALVAKYKQMLGAKFDQKVGEVDGLFPRGGNPALERFGETSLTNLTADAVRQKYGTEIVFLSGGGFRDTLPAGGYSPLAQGFRRPGEGSTGPYDVLLGDIESIFPFRDNAATSTMTGTQLKAALENGVSAYPDGRFPQISGFRFTFDPSRRIGSRVLEVEWPDGTPIPQDSTEITVTTVEFMVKGGDGYVGFFNPSEAVIREAFSGALLDRLQSDLAAGTITPVTPPDGRITCTGPECLP